MFIKKVLLLAAIAFNILNVNAQQDTLFLINWQENSKKVIELVDLDTFFYDVNDSFIFISDYEGNYKLLSLTDAKVTNGNLKAKIRFPKIPIGYSGFRGNTPHIGIFQSTNLYEYHIDEDINYMYGGTVGDILQMDYMPKYSSVLLHILHDKEPQVHQLQMFPSFAIENEKPIYKNVPTLIKAPTTVHETRNISKISIHEEGAKVVFLANDSVLMLYKLRDLTNSYGFYDIGVDFDFGFYNSDSIFIVKKNGKALMLSIPKNYWSPIPAVTSLIEMSDFKILNQNLYCIKESVLYIYQITSNSIQLIKEYTFTNKISSYKVSKDGKKILVHAE